MLNDAIVRSISSFSPNRPDRERVIGQSAYSSAVYALLFLSFIFSLAYARHVFPIFMLVLPAYWLSTFVPGEPWEKLAFIPLLLLIGVDLIVFPLAIFEAYTPQRGLVLVFILNIFSAFAVRKGKSVPPAPDTRSIQKGEGFFIVLLLAAVSVFFFYGCFFPYSSFDNGPYASFAQMGLHILRQGSFYFMTSAESCYNTTALFYPPAFSGLIAWVASWLPHESLAGSLGFVPPFLFAGFCGIFLVIGYRLGWDLKTTVLCLLLLIPSYAIFRISYEIHTDTPDFILSAFFFFLLIHLTQAKESSEHASAWFFLGLSWAFSWWVRSYLGIFFTFTLTTALVFSSRMRSTLKAAVSPNRSKWIKPAWAAAFFSLLLFGPFWEAMLWVHTGSPIAPYAIRPFGLNVATLKPEFRRYAATANESPSPASTTNKKSRLEEEAALVQYDFFPVTLSQGWKSNVFKSARAMIHGNTFSGLFTVLMLLGLAVCWSGGRTRLFSPAGFSSVYLMGMAVLLLSHYYYYKILYAGIPFMLFFIGQGLRFAARRLKKWGGFALGFAGVVSTAVFIFSFLWSGVGTWPDERRWGPFQISLFNPEQKEWLKNGHVLKGASDYLRTVPDGKFLYFHSEPGHALSFASDIRPFWADYHYDSNLLRGLHQLSSRRKVLKSLQALGITHIIVSYDLTHYLTDGEPNGLPRMLLEGDPALRLVASSNPSVYKIYKVETEI